MIGDKLIADFCKDAAYLTETERIELLDTEKYYNLFMTERTSKTPGNKLTYYMTSGCIEHVITTRKILPLYYTFFTYVIYLFKNHVSVTKLFERYTKDEIINIITYDILQYQLVNINGSYYIYTFLLYSMITYNYVLFDYMLSYLVKYEIALPKIGVPNVAYVYNLYSEDSRVSCIAQLNYHEAELIYKRSLRNAWITSCITI